MKTSLILLTVLAAGTVAAQSPKQMEQKEHSAKTTTSLRLYENLFVVAPPKPNEIDGRRVTYSGVFVQAVKTKEPWQLVNPFAPEEYGSGHQNLDRDIITGKVTGFKFFSINF